MFLIDPWFEKLQCYSPYQFGKWSTGRNKTNLCMCVDFIFYWSSDYLVIFVQMY